MPSSRLIGCCFLACSALVATACGGGGSSHSAARFHGAASQSGYTVLIAKTNPFPPGGSGPCVALVPSSQVHQTETSHTGSDTCNTTDSIYPLRNDLSGGLVAVWGLASSDVASVTVGGTHAVVDDGTFLAVSSQPSSTAFAYDHSGKLVASATIPPSVP